MMKDVVLLKSLKDRHGRVYREEDLLNQVVGKSFSGELGNGGMGTTMDLERVSHTVTNIRIVDNDLVGDIDFLKTPMGIIASTLVGEGVNLRTSIRAVGNVNEKLVVENLIVFGFDLIMENE
jgi:hypothetical protein